MVLLTDYDIAFQQLNAATLIGNVKVAQVWILGFDADYRRSPLLELSNALIGQSAPDLTTLRTEFTPSQIRQLALDRTATSETAVVSVSRPFGERWQFMLDFAALRLSGTPASGGVACDVIDPAWTKTYRCSWRARACCNRALLHIFGVRFDDSPTARSTTLSWDARFALPGAWRIGPRLSVEQLNNAELGGRQMLCCRKSGGIGPAGDLFSKSSPATSCEKQQQTLQQQALNGQVSGAPVLSTVDQRSLYVSAAYRLRF